MAENSLNVSVTDDVENLLVKIGVANKGEILGKKFTYGLGQLNFNVAREAENYVAKLEGREPVSDSVLTEAILIPEKSIYYIAAVLRKSQDDYKKQGIDIADKPEILTTLYNLGKTETRAAELKTMGTSPKPNYFGFFVKRYQYELSFLQNAPEKKSKIDTQISSKIQVLTPQNKEASETKHLKLAFTKNMPLYSAPPTCGKGNDYGATNLQNKYDSMKTFAVAAIAEKEKSFQMIAPSIDCEANTWELIKLSSGETGWIKKDDLDKTTSKILIAENRCAPKVDLKCSESLRKQIKDNLIDGSSKQTNEIYLSPFSNGKKASFNIADWECISAKKDLPAPSGTALSAPSGGGMIGGSGFYGSAAATAPVIKIGKATNTENSLKDVISKIDQKKKEIEDYYKAGITDPINPYSSVPLGYLKDGIQKCANKQIYKLNNCQLDLSQVDKLLSAIELGSKISQDDIAHLIYNMMSIPQGAPYVTKDAYLKITKSNTLNYGMGGMYAGSYPGSFVDSQYAFREEDEALWKMEDVERALKECTLSLDEVEKKEVVSGKFDANQLTLIKNYLGEIKSTVLEKALEGLAVLKSKPDSDREKLWKLAQGEFVQTSKICLSLKDTFDLETPKNYDLPSFRNYNCYFRNLNVLENGQVLMLKSFVKEMMLTPNSMAMLQIQFQSAFNPYKMTALGLVQPPQFGFLGSGSSVQPQIEERPSYCPNKTAEMIEELVKNNPCVEKIYVPDKWLLNRLNELGDKVIFKPFAEDDRFSIDVEKTSCK